uniref:4-hydroxyphenylpyruvate dioxygenase n=1 Tax=Salvator merianae TaxID=96440 RepID=A0A8D0DYC8_SALMN
MMPALLNRICHIGFHIVEGQQLASNLVQRFGFELFATRVAEWSKQLAFRRGDAIFVVNERLKPTEQVPPASSSGHCKEKGILYDVEPQHAVSTASNICFEVEDIPDVSQNLRERGCQLLVPPTTVADEGGSVTYCVVKSVVGNISHTLLDRSQYSGLFLPGFRVVDETRNEFQADGKVTHFDHITFACPQGSSQAVVDWYKNCLGFRRFLIHEQDHVCEGYRIQGPGVGLRLTAMSYSRSDSTLPNRDCKFVLAESLPGQSSNQVDAFLKQHGGAGIQHVALYTSDIVGTAAAMSKSGANFFKPPLAYYSDKGKEQEIKRVGLEIGLLRDHGILLDADTVGEGSSESLGPVRKPYLMQVFTKPLFTEETFFLELIERWGATGFGEGNVRALWQSVQNYMDKYA